MLQYLRARLREPSTWIGLAVLAVSIAGIIVWRLHLAGALIAALTAMATPDHVLSTLPRLLLAEWRRAPSPTRSLSNLPTMEPIMTDPTFVQKLEAAGLAGLRAGVKAALTEQYGVGAGTAGEKLIDDIIGVAEKPGLQAALADLPDIIDFALSLQVKRAP